MKFTHFDGAFIETIEQPSIDAYLAEILTQRLPMRATPARRAMIDPDRPIAPHICFGLPEIRTCSGGKYATRHAVRRHSEQSQSATHAGALAISMHTLPQ